LHVELRIQEPLDVWPVIKIGAGMLCEPKPTSQFLALEAGQSAETLTIVALTVFSCRLLGLSSARTATLPVLKVRSPLNVM
jgi:hypothetical protein